MLRIYLDEEQFPTFGGMEIARSVDDAKKIVAEKGAPDFISFGIEEGMELIEWLSENNLLKPDFKYYLHRPELNVVYGSQIENKVVANLAD